MITPLRRDRNLQIILETGIIAVIRAQSSEQLVDVAKALREGGVKAIEVTMTTPNALEVIRQVSALMKDDCVIGVGTVLDPETARAFSPGGIRRGSHVEPQNDPHAAATRPCVPGAHTPTEILTAWEAGRTSSRPRHRPGAGIFRDIPGPLSQIRLSPPAGEFGNQAVFAQAGACGGPWAQPGL